MCWRVCPAQPPGARLLLGEHGLRSLLSEHERTSSSLVRSTPGPHMLIGTMGARASGARRAAIIAHYANGQEVPPAPNGYTPTAVDEGESAAASLLGVHEVRRVPLRTGHCFFCVSLCCTHAHCAGSCMHAAWGMGLHAVCPHAGNNGTLVLRPACAQDT